MRIPITWSGLWRFFLFITLITPILRLAGWMHWIVVRLLSSRYQDLAENLSDPLKEKERKLCSYAFWHGVLLTAGIVASWYFLRGLYAASQGAGMPYNVIGLVVLTSGVIAWFEFVRNRNTEIFENDLKIHFEVKIERLVDRLAVAEHGNEENQSIIRELRQSLFPQANLYLNALCKIMYQLLYVALAVSVLFLRGGILPCLALIAGGVVHFLVERDCIKRTKDCEKKNSQVWWKYIIQQFGARGAAQHLYRKLTATAEDQLDHMHALGTKVCKENEKTIRENQKWSFCSWGFMLCLGGGIILQALIIFHTDLKLQDADPKHQDALMTLLQVMGAVGMVLYQIRAISQSIAEFCTSEVYIEEFVKLLKLVEETSDTSDASLDKNAEPEELPADSSIASTKVGDDATQAILSCRDLHAKYNMRQGYILRGFSMTLSPGEFVAITSPSGEGKSTALNALHGILPYHGSIYWKGQNIRTLGKEWWKGKISLVPQRQYFLNDEFRREITFLRKDDGRIPPDPRVAARQAHILDLIESVGGMSAELGNDVVGGEVLSGGQLLRVLWARAFYEDTEVVMVDEGFTSLEPKLHYLILEELRKLGKTCLFVTHNPEILRRMDRIIFIEDGRDLPSGTFDEMVKMHTGFRNQLGIKPGEEEKSGAGD
jgi:ABC-type multidrug transport system fused ATPase/permease subunit